MRGLVLLPPLLALLGRADLAEEGSCPAGGCAQASPPARDHHWPNKGGKFNSSGLADITVDRDLWQISWSFTPASIVHTSPVIDDEGNVYITETGGRLVSLTKAGALRWTYKTPGTNPGVPALAGDALFCFTDKGVAFSLALADGQVRWTTQIGNSGPSDSASVVVAGGLALMPANNEAAPTSDGNCDVVAVDVAEGEVRWTYKICERGPPSFNILPAVVDGTVIVHDKAGGMHAFALGDGAARWFVPGPTAGTFSTGASGAGPLGLAYSAFNHQGYCDDGKGMVRAHDIATGAVAWTRTFEKGVNAGVAVGKLGPKGRTAVLVMVSDNFMPQLSKMEAFMLMNSWVPRVVKEKLMGAYTFPAEVLALDAETGEDIWRMSPGEKVGWGYAGVERGCLPDCFGTPSIGADGTVYVNWSVGVAAAMRDADGDGVIDKEREVTYYSHGFGTNGQTAIAPGLLVAPSCEGIFAWAA